MSNIDPIEEGRKLQAAAVAAQEEADKIPPTPSQEENDKAKLGIALDDDGKDTVKKVGAAEKPATYQTRAAKAD
jgi:hypothetical protein